MNVTQKMMDSYGSNVLFAARKLNREKTNYLTKTFQSDWERGVSFTSAFGGFGAEKHEVSIEEEACACSRQLYQALRKVVEKEWFLRLSREDAVSIGNALIRSTIVEPATITICHEISYGASEIVDLWNMYHPDEQRLVMPEEGAV